MGSGERANVLWGNRVRSQFASWVASWKAAPRPVVHISHHPAVWLGGGA